jgi:secreted trypsin-like serine protease
MNKYLTYSVLISFINLTFSQECGRSTFGSEFSIGGEYSTQGQWPWLAPLLTKDKHKFFCGSSIISDRFLLTGELCGKFTKNCQKIKKKLHSKFKI